MGHPDPRTTQPSGEENHGVHEIPKERQAEMAAHFFAELGCKIGDELTMPGSEFGPGKDGMERNDEAGWKVMDFLMRRSGNGEYIPAARLNAPSILDGLDRDEFRTVSIDDLMRVNPHLKNENERDTVRMTKPEDVLN